MKITDVRACQPISAESPDDWRTTIGQILVAIDTDAGVTGYGVGGGGAAGIHVIEAELRSALVGRDPSPVEEIWDDLFDLTLPYGQAGIAIMAQSGIDLALWDLRGKEAGVPVARLLAGDGVARVGEPLPTYITVWDELAEAHAAGHRAFKLHVERNSGPDRVDRVIGTVREARAIVGPGVPLMVDAWMKWDLETTLAVAEGLEGLGVEWIEEPLPLQDTDGYVTLASQSPIPIAGGEHEYTSRAFQRLIDLRLHQVLQPDVCWCGGLTELVKIYRMARGTGIRVCPHRGSELWALHALAGLDPDPLPESGRPWMTWVGGQPPIVDGTVTLEDRPGLGVLIDEANLPGC
jgi:L-rhamnonate dehydratase